MDDSTSKNFGAHTVNGDEPYNMVAMTGGKYSISKQILLQRLQGILKRQENISLVFFLAPETLCILFFDIDHQVDILLIEEQIRCFVTKKFQVNPETTVLEVFATKNFSREISHLCPSNLRF